MNIESSLKKIRTLAVSASIGIIFCGVGNAFAAATNLRQVVQTQNETAPVVEDSRPYTLGLEYMVSTDFADEMSPRLFRHDITASAEYDFKNLFTAGIEGDYFFRTVGGSYSRFPEDSGLYYLMPSLTRVILDFKALGGNHKLIGMVDGDIPTNEEARIEGYEGSVGAMPMLVSNYFDGLLIFKNRLMYNVLFNRYNYSPTTFDPSPTANYGYDVGVSFRIIGGLRFGVGYGLRRTRYVDTFHDYSYRNTEMLTYSWKKLSLALKYTNGGYTDDGRADLWYVDQYRRLFSALVGFEY